MERNLLDSLRNEIFGNSSNTLTNLLSDSDDGEDKLNPTDESEDLDEEHDYFMAIDLNKGTLYISSCINCKYSSF